MALDPRHDPDRFDPNHVDQGRAPEPPEILRGLDPRYDPDRFDGSQNLTELVGKERSFEDERDNYQWAYGLLAVLGFLALVAFLFNNVLTP